MRTKITRGGSSGTGDASDPPPRHWPAALRWQHVIHHDRPRNRGLLIGRVVDDAHQLRGRGLDVVDRPGGACCCCLVGRLGISQSLSRGDHHGDRWLDYRVNCRRATLAPRSLLLQRSEQTRYLIVEIAAEPVGSIHGHLHVFAMPEIGIGGE